MFRRFMYRHKAEPDVSNPEKNKYAKKKFV